MLDWGVIVGPDIPDEEEEGFLRALPHVDLFLVQVVHDTQNVPSRVLDLSFFS